MDDIFLWMLFGVRQACKDLSLSDLRSLNLYVKLGMDPRKQPWYETVKGLFTEADGSKVHHCTMESISIVCAERLFDERDSFVGGLR